MLEDLAQAFNRANATDLPLFMYETGEQRKTLKDVLENAGTISSAAVITGPEGGFEPYEAQLAEVMKLHICSMGRGSSAARPPPWRLWPPSCTPPAICEGGTPSPSGFVGAERTLPHSSK